MYLHIIRVILSIKYIIASISELVFSHRREIQPEIHHIFISLNKYHFGRHGYSKPYRSKFVNNLRPQL